MYYAFEDDHAISANGKYALGQLYKFETRELRDAWVAKGVTRRACNAICDLPFGWARCEAADYAEQMWGK